MTKKAEPIEITVAPDWPAFRVKGVFRGIKQEDGNWILVGDDGESSTMTEDELNLNYEPCQVWG